ncbi:MAG: methylisocitrate lyase [Micavibrio sp.]|nr:methylisocitrate lyase [Micavibrio sp.]
MKSQGLKFKQAIQAETPLQIPGAVNAYTAMQVERAGFKAVYLSGGGVAYASNGYPDLGITDMHDVLEEARKITATVDIPLLADIDVGWGGAFNIARTIKEMTRAGVAAVHMEDQIAQKRCGHRPNKELVSKAEMGDRIKAAVDGKTDPDFVIMARCDAFANEGLEAMIERMIYYVDCGADMLFAEAMNDLTHYQTIKDATGVPLLANITEFGKTDLYTTEDLKAHGVDMALYPLSAFRAQAKAAETVLGAIRKEGSQASVLDMMQTRSELYATIDNAAYEEKLDKLFGK